MGDGERDELERNGKSDDTKGVKGGLGEDVTVKKRVVLLVPGRKKGAYEWVLEAN